MDYAAFLIGVNTMSGMYAIDPPDDHPGEVRERSQFCRCRRCGGEFTKPSDYPEWTTRVCDTCHAEMMTTQDRKAQDVA